MSWKRQSYASGRARLHWRSETSACARASSFERRGLEESHWERETHCGGDCSAKASTSWHAFEAFEVEETSSLRWKPRSMVVSWALGACCGIDPPWKIEMDADEGSLMRCGSSMLSRSSPV